MDLIMKVDVMSVELLCFGDIDQSVLRGWVDRENGGLMEVGEGLLSSKIMLYKKCYILGRV